MSEKAKEVALMIADISGYTRFMTANETATVHGQVIITQLMKAILKEAKLPLKISKLEGDAVFFYLEKEGNEGLLRATMEGLTPRIERMIVLFHQKIRELVVSNLCPCGACQHIADLKLKIVVHFGKALFYRLDRFMELSGSDVILVHRLLKNSIQQNEYVLFTDAAFQQVSLPAGVECEEGREHYEDFEVVKTHLYLPKLATPKQDESEFETPFFKWKRHQLKVWGERFRKWGFQKEATYRNLNV